MTDKIKVETRGKVRVITLNRPEVRNAFDEELLEALASAVIDADHDDSIVVIAVTGAGTAFSSGDDLRNAREKADAGKPFRGPLRSPRRTICEVMIDARKPTIAVVNGPAIAGGFELALACDMMIAAETAFFGLPEAKRGRGAHFASVALPQMIPQRIAMEWLLTGRRIELAELERWGLVNRVVVTTSLMDETMIFLDDIVSSAPLSLQRLKLTYRKTQGMPLAAGLRVDTGPDVYASEDQKEGARAYVEKRPPIWRGK